ncbi:MAG: YfhO family protein [Clostridiales bacterium]|nr:YfhO family protein [Clostridiales bacterium]
MEKTSNWKARAAQGGFLALVFLSLTLLLYLGFRGDNALTTSGQKLVFPLGISLLLSGLVTLLFYLQLEGGRSGKKRGVFFYPVFAGVLSVVCMFLALSYMGVAPVGERSTMVVDMHHQYAPLLANLRERLLHGEFSLYSFDIGLGTSYLPLFGYYLSSPFNLLLLFFPENMLTDAILVITLIKVALTAACFALCVQYIHRRRDLLSVAGAVMYALMMYMLAYFWNLMWLDVVMVLPLVVMCFEKLMREGKYLPYVLTLAYALYANYYIGFMLCVFMVVYYLFYALRKHRTREKQGRSFLRFAIGSALGGGLVMFLLVPVFLALGSTSAAGEGLPEMKNNFDMFQLLGRHLYEVSPTIRAGNLPNVYCGILPLFLLPVFVTQKSIPLRRRLAYMGMLAVMAFSLVVNHFDLLWHGLHSPNDLPYRFSFLYSFVLILIAYETLLHLREVRFRQIAVSLAAILSYLVIEERLGDEVYGFNSIYISLLLAVIYAVVAVLISRRKLGWRPAASLLLLVVVAEMTFNGGATLRTLNSKEYCTKRADYVDNDITRAIRAGLAQIKETGDAAANGAFYRMEFLPRRTTVDTALFSYPGITVFASSNPYNLTKYMGGIGYAVNGVNSHLYRDFVAPSDSLLGIRYVLLNEEARGSHLNRLGSVTEGASAYTIYENPYALPLAYFVQPEIRDWSYTKYNPIFSQNALFTALTGNDADLYAFQTVEVASGSEATARVTGQTSISVTPSGSQKAGKFVSTISAPGQYYVYVDCGASSSISVACSDRKNWTVSKSEPYIINAGDLTEGDTLTVTINAEKTCSGNIYVVRLDEAVFEQDMATLAAHGMTVTSFSDSRISGVVTAPASGVIYSSIPYDKGWTVTVDGQRVETFAGGEAMLAFEVDAGEHTVEFRFFPVGLIPGVVISVVSLGLLILLLLYVRRGRRSGEAPATVAVPVTLGELSAANGAAEDGDTLLPPESSEGEPSPTSEEPLPETGGTPAGEGIPEQGDQPEQDG